MMFRKGISLVVLIITIVVTIILSSAAIISIGNSIENAKLVAFAKELNDIETRCQMYYYENNELPYLDSDIAMSQGELLNLVNEGYKDTFLSEMELNNDKLDSDELGAYYKMDLSKIGTESVKRGVLASETDVFVISYPSMKIYYLDGVQIGNKRYFSLTPNLSNITKIEDVPLEDISENVTIHNLPGFTIRKKNTAWSNNFGITLSGYLPENRELYIKFSGMDERRLSISSGSFLNIEIIDLNSLRSQGLLEITDEEVFEFLNLPNKDKNISIIEKENGVVIGEITISLSNYDYVKPVISNSSVDMVLNNSNVECTFKVSDDSSLVKEVRYYTVSDSDTDTNMYTEQFVRSRGKKAVLDTEFNVSFSFNVDVRKVIIAVIDRAGNINLYSSNNKYYSPYIFDAKYNGQSSIGLDRNLESNIVVSVSNHDNEFYTNSDIEYAISISNVDGSTIDNLDFSIGDEESVNGKITRTIKGGSSSTVDDEIKLFVPNGKKLFNQQEIKVRVYPVDRPSLAKEFRIVVGNYILKDHSSNGFDATLKNGIKVIKDEEGLYALEFDGINDFVQIPNIPAGIFGEEGIRAELVVTWDSYNKDSRILSLSNGENKESIIIKNNGDTGVLFFRVNAKGNKNLDLMSSNSVIELGKKTSYYIRWVKGGKGEDGVVLWWRGDIDVDGVEIKREGTEAMHTLYPMLTDARTINYLGKSDNASDPYFKGKLYSIKLSKADNTVIFEYDINK